MLAMRLARPATVIDINNIAKLSGIDIHGGEIVIKACTRQATALASPLVQTRLPLLAKAIAYVGHQQPRSRGTMGGSLCHADPAAEIPLAALAMDASVKLRSVAGTRQLPLGEYFLGPMITARADDEFLLSVHLPVWPDGARNGTAFHEVSARQGDFAVVAAAAQIHLDAGGVCTRAALAIGGLAHCVGAALYEKFAYDGAGQFLSATFADYLMPSAHGIPDLKDVEHCTPSPLTCHGQMGSDEGGYLGAPALFELPMRVRDIAAPVNDGYG